MSKRPKLTRADNFLNTKRRTITASWTFVDGDILRRYNVPRTIRSRFKTELDPVGILMGKQVARVQIVDYDDWGELSVHPAITTVTFSDFPWGVELGQGEVTHEGTDKATAYIESVSQAPDHQKIDGPYTNATHWNVDFYAIDFDKIEWFDNVWEDNSWDDHQEYYGPPCFWTKNDHDGDDPHTKAWEKFDARIPDFGWRVTYDRFTTYEFVLRALVLFLVRYPKQSHVWIQGTCPGGDDHEDMNPTETIARLKADIKAACAQYFGGMRPYMEGYWSTDVATSTDLYHYYAGRPPQRIPVIPWRVSNYGMRKYGGKLNPQVFPASTWAGKLYKNADPDDRYFTDDAIYSNYSPFVHMVPIWEGDDVDYAWVCVGPNQYVMRAMPRPHIPGEAYNAFGILLKVAAPEFFMGLGSVATAQHSCFGVGRSESELMEQAIRRVATGHDTSGHMIASALCHRAHFLWYLEEVYTNMMSKKSIYLMPFNEPAGTEYHSIEEYGYAVNDMGDIIERGGYPYYARAQVGICRDFVSLLKN